MKKKKSQNLSTLTSLAMIGLMAKESFEKEKTYFKCKHCKKEKGQSETKPDVCTRCLWKEKI